MKGGDNLCPDYNRKGGGEKGGRRTVTKRESRGGERERDRHTGRQRQTVWL